MKKTKLCTQEWYYLSVVRVFTILCKKRSAHRKTVQSKIILCYLLLLAVYTLICTSVSIAMLTKLRSHHNQCWSLVSTCLCHPSCPMIRPVKDHHQSLGPCACSTSEYPSFFPFVDSSWLEEHRHVVPSIPCQKASNEQEAGCAHQCQLGQP